MSSTAADSNLEAIGVVRDDVDEQQQPQQCGEDDDEGEKATLLLREGVKRYDLLVKLIMVGQSGVGKTCLLSRLVEGKYEGEASLPTIVIDFRMKVVRAGQKDVKLQIWDASGKERFSHIRDNFFLGASGALFCFDVGNRESFEQLDRWIKEVKEKANNEKLHKAIVACKSDTEDKIEVSKDEAQNFAITRGAKYFETSAKTGQGVEQLFENLALAAVDDHQTGRIKTTTPATPTTTIDGGGGGVQRNNRASFRDFKLMRKKVQKNPSTRSLGKSFRFKRTSDQEAAEIGQDEVELNEELKDENLQLPKRSKKTKSVSFKLKKKKSNKNNDGEDDDDETAVNCNQLVAKNTPSCCTIS